MSLLSPPLEAFWAVVRKGTVQDASYILGITQTGVTQRIRSLEKQLKTTLFTRPDSLGYAGLRNSQNIRSILDCSLTDNSPKCFKGGAE